MDILISTGEGKVWCVRGEGVRSVCSTLVHVLSCKAQLILFEVFQGVKLG